MNRIYFTVAEAAELLRTTPITIRVKIREGKIPTHPFDGNPLIPREFIEKYDLNSVEAYREIKLRQQLDNKENENPSSEKYH